MGEERPRRQRAVRATSDFYRGGLLRQEEIQLRKALYASLKEVKTTYNKKTRHHPPTANFKEPHSNKHENFKTQSKGTESIRNRSPREFRTNLALRKRVIDETTTTVSPENTKRAKRNITEDSGMFSKDIVKGKKKTCSMVEVMSIKDAISSSQKDEIPEAGRVGSKVTSRVCRKLRRARPKRETGQILSDYEVDLEDVYSQANIAKTEDFLTFLCLRGNSSLPKSLEIFNNPSNYYCAPPLCFPDGELSNCPTFPSQSSVTYSPPLSSIQSDSSAASPMSSTGSWSTNDE